jgi:hypothetical protein
LNRKHQKIANLGAETTKSITVSAHKFDQNNNLSAIYLRLNQERPPDDDA